MGILGDTKDMRQSVCREFIEKEFGDHIQLINSKDGTYMTACHVTPLEGDSVISFDVGGRDWFYEDDFDAFVNIIHDGKVFVSYPQQDPDDSGMYFRVEHPREVAELLHLIVHPQSVLAPADETKSYAVYKLGELFSFKVLMPCGKAWCTLDPENLPVGEPEDLRRLLHTNIVRNWDGFTLGDAIQASKFAERWPDYVNALPDAAPDLRAGYLLDFEGCMRSAVDVSVSQPDPDNFFLDVLMVPRKDEVSFLYLRELLSGDASVNNDLKAAFARALNTADLFAALVDVTVRVPRTYYHQIRHAAENQMVGGWLLQIAEQLVKAPSYYYSKSDTNWHLAHVLRRLLSK